jgi:hypothetical protein
MDKKSRILPICLALIAGLGAGTLSFGPISALAGTDKNSVDTPSYSVNAHGQTYGSNMYAEALGHSPDLILAEGVDGKVGYIKNEDLNKDQPQNPQEAMEYMKKQENGPAYTEIPLYESDGETVIGTYKVFNSGSKEGQANGTSRLKYRKFYSKI